MFYSNRTSFFNQLYLFQTTPVTTTATTNNNIITQDSLNGANLTLKQEPVEPPDIKSKPNSSLPLINSPNVPHINTSKLQPPQNHFDPNMPLNVSLRLPDSINERKNLIKCNLENQMDVKDLKFNPDGMRFNQDMKQEVLKFPGQQEFKKEPVLLKKESKIDNKDCYGKFGFYLLC